MKLIWWRLKMSYNTVYPSWDGPSVVCYLFLYLFICVPTTSCTWLSTFCTLQLSSTIYLSQDQSWCRASFLKGIYNFQNCLRIQFVKVLHNKVHWKTLHPFYHPSFFFLNVSPIKNLKEALNISTGMYCNTHLLEIMRRSSFKSPLSYPSS
jgi:hypothetical protein